MDFPSGGAAGGKASVRHATLVGISGERLRVLLAERHASWRDEEGDSGVVDQHVEAAVPGGDGVVGARDGGVARDIKLEGFDRKVRKSGAGGFAIGERTRAQ